MSIDAIILGLFDRARRVAWSNIKTELDIVQVIQEQDAAKEIRELKQVQTANLLTMYR